MTSSMKLHRIIKAKSAFTIEQIKAISLSKGECFGHLEETFDWSVPQEWLDEFASWCKAQSKRVGLGVDYDMIHSTTVWGYGGDCNTFGKPVTCCVEVYYAFTRYERFLAGESDY